MKKRFLSGLLALLMLLSFVPTGIISVSAAASSEAANPQVIALHETATSDQKRTEKAWFVPAAQIAPSEENAPSGTLYLAWDATYLWVGVKSDNSRTIDFSLGDCTKNNYGWRIKDAEDGFTEAGFLWSAIGTKPTDFNQVFKNMTLTLHGKGDYQSLSTTFTADVVLSSLTAGALAMDTSLIRCINSATITDGVGTIAPAEATGQHAFLTWKSTYIDHTKDIIFSQTLCIKSLPTGKTGVVSPSNKMADSCYFFCLAQTADATNGSALYCVVYADSDKNLFVRVYNDPASPATCPSAALGKKIGDTFCLSALWNADESASIYVDGAKVLDVENATLTSTAGLGSGIVAMRYYSKAATTANIEVSNLVLATASTMGSALDGVTIATLLPGVNLDNVQSDLSLPASYHSSIFGDIPLTWTSSNPAVLSNDGKVTCPSDGSSASATLSVSVSGKTLDSATVTVSSTAAARTFEALCADEITVDNSLSEGYWASAYAFGSESETAPHGSAYLVYNKNGLYLGLKHQNASSAEIKVGSKTATLTLTGSETELLIPYAELGFTPTDYNQTVTGFTVTLRGDNGSATLGSTDSSVCFTNKKVNPIDYTSLGKLGGDYLTVSGNSLMVNNTAAKTASGLYKQNFSFVDHGKDLLVTQTLCIEALPARTGTINTNNQYADGCYYFWVCDYADKDGTSGTALFGVVYADAEGNLYLRIRGDIAEDGTANAGTALNRKLGDTFQLSIRWNADGSAVAYVDGVQVLAQTNATLVKTSGLGTKCVQMRYYTTAENSTGKFTVSNFSVTAATQDSVLDEITSDALLPNTDLTNVQNDLDLATSYESAYLGSVAVTYVSSNPDVLSNTGEITPPATGDGVDVELSAYAGSTKLWTKTVHVASLESTMEGPVPASPDHITAAFTASAITIDGKVSEEGWVLSSRLLDSDKMVRGKMGVQWTKDTLYLAFKAPAASTLALSIGGKSTTVSLSDLTSSGDFAISQIAKKGSFVELAVSFSALGITANHYDISFPITVTLDSAGTYTGTVSLDSVDWFAADNEYRPIAAPVVGHTKYGNSGAVAGYQGYSKTSDGWRMYDLYNPDGVNPEKLRTYVIFMNDDIYEPLADRSKTIYHEFDFYAESMPVYSVDSDIGWAANFASYGMTWWISDAEDASKNSNSCSFGIINTENGLVFAALRNGGAAWTKELGKEVGDLFRVGVAWKTDGSVVIYIDGELFAEIADVECRRNGFGNKTLAFNLIRNETAAASTADNMDVYITNVSIGHALDKTLIDSLTFDTIRGENTEQTNITTNLTLPTQLQDTQLDLTQTVTWSSTVPTAIGTDGTVTRPSVGATDVVLTATLSDGTAKSFNLRVMGLSNESGNVLVLEKDWDPSTGKAAATDEYEFTLDSNNSSVVIDLESRQAVNVVVLKDADSAARLNEEVLQLWVSDDNETYTRVKDFKLLHKGQSWYLYDFSANARYVKVHCTHFNGEEASFIAPAATMISAYHEDVFGGNSGTFQSKTVTVRNTGSETRYDAAWKISKTGLGLTGSDASIRVSLNGNLLYHYTDDTAIYVRIPELAAGASATLTVLYGNDSAMDISNKEYVYEVTYGTREVFNVGGNPRWVMTLPTGRLLGFTEYGSELYCCFSDNDGVTWTAPKMIECTKGLFTETSGFTYDPETGYIYVHGHRVNKYSTSDINQSDAKVRVIRSKDNGETWEYIGEVEGDSTYMLSYTNGIVLSSYDGEDGPNVDFVFPMGVQYNSEGGFCCRVAYSTDAGNTWHTSESKIIYDEGSTRHEGGLSEATIQEREDGVLVLIVRNQTFGEVHFAQSYSYDHGLTWQVPAKLSSVYSVNTQPIMFKYGDETLLTWGGNNMYGCSSYIRTPYNIAVSYDGMETFRNIQDIYSKYSLQGLTAFTMNRITNQSVTVTNEDTFITTWMNLTKGQSERSELLMRVEDFGDFFYRTKGAYDSFEHGTIRYEGWEITSGDGALTTEWASDGSSSMKLTNAIAARSIPSIEQGTISMDIYATDAANFSVELQAAYSNVSGQGAPVGIRVENGVITFFGEDTASGLSLAQGKNTLTFELNLNAAQPYATFTLNDNAPVSIPVRTEIGDYVNFLTIMNSGSLMVDNVLVESDLDALNVKAEYEANVPVAESVRDKIDAIGTVTLDSADAIEAARAAYDALTEEQKALVFNYATLEEAEDLYAELAGDQEPVPPVTPVIPSVSPISKPTNTNKNLPFTDVSRSDWFYSEVKEAYESGIMNGTSATRFEPNTAITRAMVVTILYRLENEPAVNGTCRFTDVASGSYYEKAVIWASENGIVTGYNETTFGPSDSITREQLAAILYRYAKYKGCDMSAKAELSRYTDASAVSTYATAPMEWAVGSGLISGTSASLLSPGSTANRAQVAVIIIRFLDLNAN